MDLSSGTWQGVSGIVAILSFLVQTGVTVWAALRQDRKDAKAAAAAGGGDAAVTTLEAPAASTLVPRLAGAVLIWITSYLVYALIWLLLTIGLNQNPGFVLSPVFTVMAVVPGTGALLVRSPFLGGALGGALGIIGYVFLPANSALMVDVSPQAWIVVGLVVGGGFGAIASGGAVTLAHARGIPLPRGRLPEDTRPMSRRVLRYLAVAGPIALTVVVILLAWQGPRPATAFLPGYVASPAEQQLLAALPTDFGATVCHPAPERTGIAITAAVACSAVPGDGPTAASFYRFASAELLDGELRAQARTANVPEGDAVRCRDAETFHGPWHGPDGSERGRLMCYVTTDGAFLAWTDHAATAYGVMQRRDGDLRSLYGRWQRMEFAPAPAPAEAPPMTEQEQRLLAETPTVFAAHACRPAPERENSLITAALVCTDPANQSANSAVFLRYTDTEALDQGLVERAKWLGLPEVDGDRCGARPAAYGPWLAGGEERGYVACRPDLVGYTMFWTDRKAKAFAIVNRADGNAVALEAWWARSSFITP